MGWGTKGCVPLDWDPVVGTASFGATWEPMGWGPLGWDATHGALCVATLWVRTIRITSLWFGTL